MDPKVIFEDKHLLILDKPAGWITNEVKTKGSTPTIEDWLRARNIDQVLSIDWIKKQAEFWSWQKPLTLFKAFKHNLKEEKLKKLILHSFTVSLNQEKVKLKHPLVAYLGIEKDLEFYLVAERQIQDIKC